MLRRRCRRGSCPTASPSSSGACPWLSRPSTPTWPTYRTASSSSSRIRYMAVLLWYLVKDDLSGCTWSFTLFFVLPCLVQSEKYIYLLKMKNALFIEDNIVRYLLKKEFGILRRKNSLCDGKRLFFKMDNYISCKIFY